MTDDLETKFLSARVFAYATLAVVAVSLVLALAFGVALMVSMSELSDLRHSLVQARESERVCQISVVRLDAKLEQFEAWLNLSAGNRGQKNIGGK
jgi:hypothetical protein